LNRRTQRQRRRQRGGGATRNADGGNVKVERGNPEGRRSGGLELQFPKIQLGGALGKVQHFDAHHLIALVEIQHHAWRHLFGLDESGSTTDYGMTKRREAARGSGASAKTDDAKMAGSLHAAGLPRPDWKGGFYPIAQSLMET